MVISFDRVFAVFVVCYNVIAVVALVIVSLFCTCRPPMVDYNGAWVAELLMLVNVYHVIYLSLNYCVYKKNSFEVLS